MSPLSLNSTHEDLARPKLSVISTQVSVHGDHPYTQATELSTDPIVHGCVFLGTRGREGGSSAFSRPSKTHFACNWSCKLEGGRKQCVFEAFQNALCLQLELQLEGGRKQCVFEAFQNALCLQLELQLEGGRKQCVFEAFQNALCLQLELQLEGGRKQCVFEAFQNALCLQLDGGKGERKRVGLPKRTGRGGEERGRKGEVRFA